MNSTFITKLGWKVCTHPQRIWVKLIRSRHMRKRRVVEFQQTTQASLWVWNCIQRCKKYLNNGLCYMMVTIRSVLKIEFITYVDYI